MSARPPRIWPWVLLPVVAVIAAISIAVVGFLTVGRAGPWPWWGFFPWFPFVGIGIVFGFLFLFSALRWSWGPWCGYDGGYRGYEDQSRAILRERYARGEVTREQFDELRRHLDEHLMQNAYEGGPAGRSAP